MPRKLLTARYALSSCLLPGDVTEQLPTDYLPTTSPGRCQAASAPILKRKLAYVEINVLRSQEVLSEPYGYQHELMRAATDLKPVRAMLART